MWTRRATMLGVLWVGVGVLGGWWTSRAAIVAARPAPVRSAADTTSPHDESWNKLLDEVHRRSVVLAQRDRDLTQRALALKSVERIVDEALAELAAREAGSDTTSCKFRGRVAHIYASMRPTEAAQILDQLDDDTLRTIFARMEVKRVAAIMAAMNREHVVAFTRALAADAEPAAAEPQKR